MRLCVIVHMPQHVAFSHIATRDCSPAWLHSSFCCSPCQRSEL